MPDSIDDLARRWKAQPDAAGAITLCDAIRNSSPAAWKTLVEEVGKLAAEKHAADGAVLLAVGRLYAASDKLGDAQAVLVAAGRVGRGMPRCSASWVRSSSGGATPSGPRRSSSARSSWGRTTPRRRCGWTGRRSSSPSRRRRGRGRSRSRSRTRPSTP